MSRETVACPRCWSAPHPVRAGRRRGSSCRSTAVSSRVYAPTYDTPAELRTQNVDTSERRDVGTSGAGRRRVVGSGWLDQRERGGQHGPRRGIVGAEDEGVTRYAVVNEDGEQDRPDRHDTRPAWRTARPSVWHGASGTWLRRRASWDILLLAHATSCCPRPMPARNTR
jgi:hypothetical protein